MNEKRWAYFEESEVKGLDFGLVGKLDIARGIAGVPFQISCGVRSEEENQAVGGVERSSHEIGKGVDIACSDSSARFAMVAALLHVGFKRIGVYDRHIHVDTDDTKPQNVMWWGKSH